MAAMIGATTAKSKRDYPPGFPTGLVVRGLGNALFQRLDELGEPCTEGTAVVLVHVSADGQAVTGPMLAVRGPTFTLGLTPKMIWGEVRDDGSYVCNDLAVDFYSQGTKGHAIEFTVNMNAVDFPTAGPHRMLSKWADMTSSQDFVLKDKAGAVKKDLSKVRGAVRT